MAVEPSFEMWATLVLTVVAIVAYASERISVELASIGILVALLLLFHFTPLLTGGEALLGPDEVLGGFSSPALIAVSALLVVGQAMVSTGALEGIARFLVRVSRGSFYRAFGYSLGYVTASSGLLNNTPIVVIFMPILRSIAERYGRSASAVMMPLSFAAILGGMLTLIGTSTNLLVSGELAKLGQPAFDFFDLTVPGLVLATVGGAYVLALPVLIPQRDQPPGSVAADGKQFIAELDVTPDSNLVGETSRGGLFPALADVTVRLIQRDQHMILPPFEDVVLQPGDVLIVAATRKVLTEILAKNPGHLLRTSGAPSDAAVADTQPSELVLAEAMIKPASRMIGQTLELTNFPARSRCIVLGIQRRARMLRTRLHELRLEPGDVLLLIGRQDAIDQLRADPDVLLMEWSASEMPLVGKAPLAAAIFAAIVLPAAVNLVPIVITALFGVVALVATGCLNVRQAARAVDRQIVLVIASALALGTALEATGGAAYLAMLVLQLMQGASPTAVLSVLFLIVAALTNVLTNNATAVLFTPIAVNVVLGLGTDVFPFALAVTFGASCSFATPIGYQTNLLVMGAGHYQFRDFVTAGLPLVLIVWAAFSLFVPWYYDVP
ncbi:MAG TPA: SLC13 family permease [Geminicoccaceae bacterium]|nr:SLC13 family permease [Geminicoccaceae bacterium]